MWGCESGEARRSLMRNRVKMLQARVLGHLTWDCLCSLGVPMLQARALGHQIRPLGLP